MASYQINNILKIDVSDVQSASFSVSIDVQEGPDEVHFLDRNPDSHTLETYPDDDRIYVRVTPRYYFVAEQFLVGAERDDSTVTFIKRPEELALSPVETEPVEEEVADMTLFAPAVPDVDMDVYAAEAPHVEFDDDEEAADTPAHKHDTRYQRRQRQRQQQPHHRGSISPSRYFSRPYLHQRPAVPPRQRERLQRIARAALRVLDA